jgi:putative ATPase
VLACTWNGRVMAGVRLTPTTADCGIYSYMVRDAQRGLLDTIPGNLLWDTAPIAPHIWDANIGQSHLLGPEGSLRVMLEAGALPSLIFWGPPGVGKTTIARLLAAETDLHFVQISAIFTGVPDLRKVFEAAKARRHANGQGTLLFVDEIHRFNKAQQDGFLPHMEDGTILLVGATTENPSFELNAALSPGAGLVLERLSGGRI